jgi:HEAT repeat protein
MASHKVARGIAWLTTGIVVVALGVWSLTSRLLPGPPYFILLNDEVNELANELNQAADDALPGRPDRWDRESRRRLAADALARIGPAAAPAIPALIRTLKSVYPLQKPYESKSFTAFDSSPEAACDALVRIGPAAVPALRAALRHEDARTRANAARALWQLEKNADEVLPVLWDVWRDDAAYKEDECARGDATHALIEVGRERKELVVPALSRALAAGDVELARAALAGLTQLAPDVPEALQALVAALRDGTKDLQRLVAKNLGDIGPAAVPGLRAVLREGNPGGRSDAAWQLCVLRSVEALPELTRALSDESAEVRYWAASAIGYIGPAAKAAGPALRARIDDPDEKVREEVRKALAEIEK